VTSIPLASFIVPSYGRADALQTTLGCALSQDYANFEVVVVCQDPTPPAFLDELVRANGERLRVFRQERPHANCARNLAVEKSRGEIILSIDDDVLFGPDYASRHMSRYTDPSLGFVMSLTLEGKADSPPAALSRAKSLFTLASVPRAGDVVPITWAPTCSTSYRRSAIIEAGRFDEYFTGGVADDSDIAVGIREHGFTGVLDTGIELVHLAVPSGGYASRDPGRPFRRVLNDQRMRIYFAAKHAGHMGFSHASSFYWSAFRAMTVAIRGRYGIAAMLAAPFVFAWIAIGATYSARTRRRAAS
jgi:glycosyltransferase involved in cell wall biosynthesis